MYCRVTREPIDTAELQRRVRGDSDGAVITFCGVVRNRADGRAVTGLEYEAYEEMATAAFEKICGEVAQQFDISDVAVVHRIGELGVGETSVAIAVAAPHRDAAYRASREIIERLKREVPIWKRERYVDGAEAWVSGEMPPIPEAG